MQHPTGSVLPKYQSCCCCGQKLLWKDQSEWLNVKPAESNSSFAKLGDVWVMLFLFRHCVIVQMSWFDFASFVFLVLLPSQDPALPLLKSTTEGKRDQRQAADWPDQQQLQTLSSKWHHNCYNHDCRHDWRRASGQTRTTKMDSHHC